MTDAELEKLKNDVAEHERILTILCHSVKVIAAAVDELQGLIKSVAALAGWPDKKPSVQ